MLYPADSKSVHQGDANIKHTFSTIKLKHACASQT